jgi:SAM-dependent methyltransferase
VTTSWENSQNWYDTIVGKEGHYYHRHIILPKVLGHLKEMESISLLDLGCGQGILARQLPKQTTYCGIDLSSSLIHHAKNFEKNPSRSFFVGDICAPLPIKAQFTHAVSILSIQNVEFPNRIYLCP